MSDEPKYRRVLLKLSGDAFCGGDHHGIEVEEASSLAEEVLAAASQGVQVAAVVGAGNIVRGARLSRSGVDRATADYMGMLATVINALALQDVLERRGAATRVLTAIPMQSLAEPFIRRRCIRHLEKGRIVILAAGTGNPHFTTDTAAALRATELHAEVILKATRVDGVYTADPEVEPSARRYDRLDYMEVLSKELKVMDATAISLCRAYRIPIIVFNVKKPGNIVRAVAGERIGTLIDGAGSD